jgi:hypothetical protein
MSGSKVYSEVVPLEESDGANGNEIPSTSPSNYTPCLWKTLHFCNTFAVAILACAVTVLFVQLQYVSFQLTKEQDELDQLQITVSEKTQDQIQVLTEKVDQEHSYTLYQMAGTFTLLTCLLTMFHMSSHLRNFHEPVVQRKIITILWFSPIYSCTSFLSLLFPTADGYLAVMKDFYEAYVVYTFLSFLIAVLGKGDRDAVVEILSQHADHMKAPTRLLSGFYHPPPDTNDNAKANAVLLECQILCMQFVLIRPMTSIASFVSTTLLEDQDDDQVGGNDGNDDSDVSKWAFFWSPYFYIAMVTNVTVFLAFRGLLKFYHIVAEELQWCQPFSKFMAIKGIVFLTFWQGLAISIFVNLNLNPKASGSSGSGNVTDDTVSSDDSTGSNDQQTPLERAAEMQNILICMEMLLFSIAHWCVFPSEEWEPDYRPKHYAAPGIGIKDFVSDVSYIMSSKSDAKAFRKNSSTNPSLSQTEGEDTQQDEEQGDVLDNGNNDDEGSDKGIIEGVESSLTLEEEAPYEQSKLD